jgi:thiol-disulfide isomerase/thioredoxin
MAKLCLRNTRTLIVLSLLFLTTINLAQAQENTAVDITTKGLQIGQQVPNIILNNLSNYKDAQGKITATAKLSDFKGKLVILDFWATWCAPCVAMIPRMDSLQKQFEGKVKFISVSYQSEKEVLPFLARLEQQQGKQFILTTLFADKELNQLFPHIYLPHYVWIDENGIVKAITGYDDIRANKIEKALSNVYTLTQKKDYTITFDQAKPFLLNGNGGKGNNLIYHSVLTGYVEGIAGGFSTKKPDSLQSAKILLKNLPIPRFFQIAYGEGKEWFNKNRIKYLVKDTSNLVFDSRKQAYDSWIRTNGYCYELIVPPNLASERYKIMQQDLNNFLPKYQGGLEKQIKMCLVLVRTSTVDKIASAGGEYRYASSRFGFKMQNHSISRFIADLNVLYMQNSVYPVLNETGYKKWVDMEMNAPMGDIDEMNKALAKYDLAFVLQNREVNVLVIKDNNK